MGCLHRADYSGLILGIKITLWIQSQESTLWPPSSSRQDLVGKILLHEAICRTWNIILINDFYLSTNQLTTFRKWLAKYLTSKYFWNSFVGDWLPETVQKSVLVYLSISRILELALTVHLSLNCSGTRANFAKFVVCYLLWFSQEIVW